MHGGSLASGQMSAWPGVVGAPAPRSAVWTRAGRAEALDPSSAATVSVRGEDVRRQAAAAGDSGRAGRHARLFQPPGRTPRGPPASPGGPRGGSSDDRRPCRMRSLRTSPGVPLVRNHPGVATAWLNPCTRDTPPPVRPGNGGSGPGDRFRLERGRRAAPTLPLRLEATAGRPSRSIPARSRVPRTRGPPTGDSDD